MLRARFLLGLSTVLLAACGSSLSPGDDFRSADGATARTDASALDTGALTADVPPIGDVGAVTDAPPTMRVDTPVGASDVPALTDVAATVDVPAAVDVPRPADVPVVAVDVPPAIDVPAVVDVPPAVDVPPTVDVPPVVDVPPGVDVPVVTVDVPPAADVPTISLTDGLVVQHRFDGDCTDSRYGANGTVIGVSFVADRFGVANRAARFNAASSGFSGSSVVVPSNSRLPVGASPRTLSLWTVDRRNTSTWAYRSIVNWGDIMTGTRFGLSGLANFSARTDQPIFSGQSADLYAIATNLLDSRWHHLAVTYDGATLRFYVDGALNNSGALSLNTTTRELTIGRAVVRMSEYYDGDLDDLRIYDRVLSDAELGALFHEGGWM